MYVMPNLSPADYLWSKEKFEEYLLETLVQDGHRRVTRVAFVMKGGTVYTFSAGTARGARSAP